MHVLILPSWYTTPEFPVSGIFFYEQAQALKQAGLKVGVIAVCQRSLRTILHGRLWAPFSPISYQEEEGIPTFRKRSWSIPKMPRVNGRIWIRQAFDLFERYVNQFGMPDILHAHSALWGGVAAQHIAARYGLPYIITEHSSAFAENLIPKPLIPYIQEAFSLASERIAVSAPLARLLMDRYSKKDVKVVPNVVHTDFFVPPREPRASVPFIFLTVAALTKNKGIDLLVKAFSETFRGNENFQLWVGGDGEQKNELVSLVDALGIGNQVRFLGLLSREGVRQAMWQANAFVSSSFVETFGVVLIEAMSTGLPVIATRSGGPEDFVTPEVGFLVPVGDQNALSEGLNKLFETRGNFSEHAIRESIVRRFSPTVIARQLSEIYESVLPRKEN